MDDDDGNANGNVERNLIILFGFQKMVRARGRVVLHLHQIGAPTMTVSSIDLRIIQHYY